MHRAAFLAIVAVGVFGSIVATAAVEETRLLRRPTVSQTEIAFAYAGDLWIVGREGGRARRLTATLDVETDPRFSPDGSLIAFTATVKGNTDVYVISSNGGAPRRLTYHPGLDMVRGWTRDGQRVIFGSSRGVLPTPGTSSYVRLWTVDRDGGMPQMLPMPRAYSGTFSPDGREFAYEELSTEFETKEGQWQSAQWRHYRGGRTHPIRVMNLADYSETKLPWRNSNDRDPMWIGDTLYFISDRDFTANLFGYHTATGQLEQLTHHDDFDIMSASAGPDAVVYEQAGYVHLLDTRSGKSRRLHIQVEGDFPWANPRTEDVSEMIQDATVSPDGKQIAFEARGDIFIKHSASNEAFNLTQSPGAHDRSPAWSVDGTRLAWLSDVSGEYQLFVADVRQRKRPRAVALPLKGDFSKPLWSPDGRHVLLRDNHLTLWMIGLTGGQATRIDADAYDDPPRRIDPVWSLDSRWIAYSRCMQNHLRALFLYSLDQRKAWQITESRVDALSPAFDRNGKYLYFLVSTDYGRSVEWTGMSWFEQRVTRSVHAAVLSASGTSPLSAPDQRVAGTPRHTNSAIDIDGLNRRIVALNIPSGDYFGLIAGPPGTFLYAEHDKGGIQKILAPASFSLHRYAVDSHTRDTFLRSIDTYDLSANAAQVLYRSAPDHKWALASVVRSADGSDAEVSTKGLNMRIDPRAEWANIFRETWRIQRDYFYQPTMHGANWQAVYAKYASLLSYVKHRFDLGYLLAMVGGELSVGHSALSGPHAGPGTVGMLGADYVVEHGRYRIQRIYRGDPWNPQLQAPLAVPGSNVKEGDYLFEVNGNPVAPPMSVYALFEDRAGKPTQIRVGPTPQVVDSRLVTVIPVADEESLRTYEDWTEKNRKRVDELSGGRVGYVWVPNTGPTGYQAFNRQFYAQLDKEGMIIDERYNQGGLLDDTIADALTRPLFGYLKMRDGADAPIPFGTIRGPKVMLINESAGSGGDALPHYFKVNQAGPLVGTRTWGGLVGPTAEPAPEPIDGSGISAPSAGFYDTHGAWLLENVGIAPDIEVENTPAEVIAGHDTQLERAVHEALQLLESHPIPQVRSPPPPDRVSRASNP